MYEPLPVPLSDALELLVDALPVVPTLRGSAAAPSTCVRQNEGGYCVARAARSRASRTPAETSEATAMPRIRVTSVRMVSEHCSR
jgi:hypothetical protein